MNWKLQICLEGLTREIYEALKNDAEARILLEKFNKLYYEFEVSKRTETSVLADYINKLNKIIEELAQTVLAVFSRVGQPLCLLESNDMTMLYNYLRYVCASSLALYLTIDVNKDAHLSKCKWGLIKEADELALKVFIYGSGV